MGDRVLMQMVLSVATGERVSPALYGHWAGSEWKAIVAATKERMSGRADDIDYAFARMAQIAMLDDDSDSGWGIWNKETKLTKHDSQGDAGCILIYLPSFEADQIR